MVPTSSDLVISTAQLEWRVPCLLMLFQDLAESERRARVASLLQPDDPAIFDHLLAAHRAGRLVGTIWGRMMPGRSAMIWPPRTMRQPAADVGGRLLAAVSDRLCGAGARIAYAVLASSCGIDASLLSTHGFPRVADLLYLATQSEQFPKAAPVCQFELQAYREGDSERLAKLVDATYQETRDVPALNGVRELRDVLCGYRETGEFSPSRWLFVRRMDRDVGCLLLADHPGLNQYELVYMGVIPSQRGQGWGRELTAYAQWLTSQAGRQQMTLAVDAENEPALRAYSQCGFIEYERRSIYLRVLTDEPT